VPEGALPACARKSNRITSVAAIVAPQPCDLVRGAFVLVTRARPACLLDSFLSLPPTTLAPIALCLVFLQLDQFLVRPIGDVNPCHYFGERSRDRLPLNPAVHRCPVDTGQFRRLSNRVFLHL
jgi:hypothetical protein